MTKRAWWLVVLNILIPGSAQVLAGNRRLGRFGLGATLVGWALVLALILVALLARPVLVGLVTNRAGLGAAVLVLAFYGVLWIVLTLDTLRLVRFVNIAERARGFVAMLAVVGLIAGVGGAGFLATRAIGAFDILGIFDGGQIAEPIDGRYNILLLGSDSGPDRMGTRPDSISVVSIDAQTGSTAIFGLPRNLERATFAADSPLYGPFPNGYDCGVECLISYLYTYAEEHPELYPDAVENGSTPGIEATRDAVEGVLGLTTQYFVMVNMEGFTRLVDALGGIDMDVRQRLPIEGGEDSNGRPTNVSGWIEPGPQHMDGYTALWYARSRHGTDDYDRMARQREVQEAILRQMDPANVLLRFNEIAAAGGVTLATDVPSPMLSHFVELALKAKELPLTTLDFVPDEWDNNHPDIAAIQAKVDELTAPVTPSPAP
jgi:LCP family protein required for cell wall assembly